MPDATVRMNPQDYPEHQKMIAVQHESHIIGEFLEIMDDRHGVFLAVADDHEWNKFGSIEKALYLYFDIDGKKIQEEKEAMFEKIREAQEATHG